jgi:hypothetical protein
LPALPSGGVWNTEGWFGAVLEAAPLLALATADQQVTAARDFLAVAVEACRRFVRAAS